MFFHPRLLSFSFAACYSEMDISLPGNDLNNGFNNRQDSAEACRSSCRSVTGSKFYDWNKSSISSTKWGKSCWCKHSDSGRRVNRETISGNVNCLHVTSKLEYAILSRVIKVFTGKFLD